MVVHATKNAINVLYTYICKPLLVPIFSDGNQVLSLAYLSYYVSYSILDRKLKLLYIYNKTTIVARLLYLALYL